MLTFSPLARPQNMLNRLLWIAGGIAVICFFGFIAWWRHNIEVVGKTSESLSRLTGLPCPHSDRRPFAVMMASDPVARPLSGIGQADMVFEMPVTPDGVTRMMAVFQCSDPHDIGSVRSARDGFIPLAASLDAIYAHWGGEHGALEQLNSGILNNLDALKYEGTYFSRKASIKPPHNGFTSIDQLLEGAHALGYRLTTAFSGYEHQNSAPTANISNLATDISIPYPIPYDVRWVYDQQNKIYRRFRAGTPEIDAGTGQQVAVHAVAVLETTAQPLRDQYLTITIQGSGALTLYENGVAIHGVWRKDPLRLDSKLRFLDPQGKDIQMTPGTLWVSFVTATP